jgi:hypothetical protein
MEVSMRSTLMCSVLLFALFQQKTCKLATPEHIEADFLQTLTPYFPHAQIQFAQLQGNNSVIALTCVQGAGPALVNEALQMLQAQRSKISQLKLVPKLGGARYKYIVLGFDSAVIVYDVDTGQMAAARPPADFLTGYYGACGLQPWIPVRPPNFPIKPRAPDGM